MDIENHAPTSTSMAETAPPMEAPHLILALVAGVAVVLMTGLMLAEMVHMASEPVKVASPAISQPHSAG